MLDIISQFEAKFTGQHQVRISNFVVLLVISQFFTG